MTDPHRRYEDARGRSPSGWRARSPHQWRSPSPDRYHRSPSPTVGRYSARSQSRPRWRSPSQHRNRSASPQQRREMSPRRRSRFPPSIHENPEHRRRRLLAEKVMSLAAYHRQLLDPSFKTAGLMRIPVPLAPGENVGDYQQKFKFWLAQREVNLASLQNDVMRERGYRCNYAQWRVQQCYGHPPPSSARNFSLSLSPAQARTRDEQTRGQSSLYRPPSPDRTSVRHGEPRNSAATGATSKFYDVRRRPPRNYDEAKNRDGETCCRNCDRQWTKLNRRLKQLESVVSRLDVPPANTYYGTSSSPYENYGDTEPTHGDPSPPCIDLTDDIEMEGGADSEAKEDDDTPTDKPTETQARCVEITPTDSEVNHEGPAMTDLDTPTTQPMDGLELKTPPELTLLIEAYNALNDTVLKKQREEKNVSAGMTFAEDMSFESIELRETVKKVKDKRDVAVAAIIMNAHAGKREELEQELKKVAASGATSELEDLHEKCAGIAAKLAEKDSELARLQKQLQSLSSFPVSADDDNFALGQHEAQELSSKMGQERASKVSLGTERHKIFTRLMKSSRHIQELVAKELLSKT